MFSEPQLSFFAEIVAWSVVDNQEDLLSTISSNKHFKKTKECFSVKNIGELI